MLIWPVISNQFCSVCRTWCLGGPGGGGGGVLFITHDSHIPGSLHQTEKSAGLEKGHHCHTAHRLFHWLHRTYVPSWWQLTARPTPITLCTAPMEQAEGDEQAKARPHPGSASSLPQMAKKREVCGEGVIWWGDIGRTGGGDNFRNWTATQYTQVIGLYKGSKKVIM